MPCCAVCANKREAQISAIASVRTRRISPPIPRVSQLPSSAGAILSQVPAHYGSDSSLGWLVRSLTSCRLSKPYFTAKPCAAACLPRACHSIVTGCCASEVAGGSCGVCPPPKHAKQGPEGEEN